MTGRITLTLPTEILERAELLAQRAGRPVGDLLAETIELSLRPLGSEDCTATLPANWSVAEVLAAADAVMSAKEDRRLSQLLHRQQAGTLTDAERPELHSLMQLYQERLLRKAQALREAVRRGLRKPVQPRVAGTSPQRSDSACVNKRRTGAATV
jgi:hypothetical protein